MSDLFLIAGHGEGDPGACSIWGKEADYTRELVNLIKDKIGDRLSVTVYDTDKNCYEQSKKGNVPNYSKHKFTLEVHFNAKTKPDLAGDGYYTGVGGYYHPQNPGRDIADKIVDGIAALDFKIWLKDTSTGLLNLNNAQRQNAKYFLLETAFIDDGDDMRWYNGHKETVAACIASVLVNELGDKKVKYYVRKEFSKGYSAENQAGAFNSLENALNCAMKYKGFSVFDDNGNIITKKQA
ncbi:MAG: N-acetylmuramoyl-L-alanine amidase [Eubacteriales bacterium]|nr:N-acetylmuramoyl-L-alanine amidase [Eubacteriales bacterium]